MRQLISFLFVFSFISFPLAQILYGSTDLGTIKHTIDKKTVRVHLVANDNTLERAALLAFRAHGAYEIVDASSADVVFELNRQESNSVHLKIKSSQSSDVLFQEMVRGDNAYDAALKACDLAVGKTLGIPSFFAGKLAFVGEKTGYREIWMSDLFFSKPLRLTGDKTNSLNPQLAPSGDKIIYTSYRKTFPDLYMIDLNENKLSVFADYKGTNNGGVIHPNGNWVASIFSSTGNPELWITKINKRSPKQLTHTRDGIESSPSWSPDGLRLVYSSDSGIGSPQLFQVPVNGGKSKRIHTKISGYCAEPDWNPRKANLIAFTVAVGGSFQLALYDFETNKSDFLTSGGGDNIEPCWTNDGRHLIYTKRARKSKSLWIIDTETKKTVELHSKQFGYASQADFVYPRN